MKVRLLVAAAALLACAPVPSESGTIAQYKHLVLDGHTLKWGRPRLGTGAAVTYAVIDGPMRFEKARNCSAMAPLGALLKDSRIGAREFTTELTEAFKVWERAANIVFSPSAPGTADILIGAQGKPLGYAFANVEYDRAVKGPGTRSLSQAMVCLNPTKTWKIGFDGNLEVYDLRYTLIHEIGHAIGLDHPAISGQLMAYSYGEKFRSLQSGDLRGVVALYGPPTPVIHVGEAKAPPPRSDPDKACDDAKGLALCPSPKRQ